MIGKSLINRIEDVEGIGERGSQPHTAVECEVALALVAKWAKDQKVPRKLPGFGGSTIGEQMKDRKEEMDNERLQLEGEVRKFEQIAKDDKRLWRRTSFASD